MAPSANHIAFTAPINPPGATPVLTRAQVWSALQLKIRSAETFVPKAIESTTVISEEVDPDSGNPVTVRDVVFVAGFFEGRGKTTVRERCVAYEPAKVDFIQPNGSTIHNVISEDEHGALFMTYIFEWRHPGASEAELDAFAKKEMDGSKLAVNGSIDSIRELAKSGKL
jgi:Domain of unknown function (DUF1857)